MRAPDISPLVTALGDAVLTDRVAIEPFRTDTSEIRDGGRPVAVVRARSTDDVAVALRWANDNGVRVSVRGAGTGLSGGAVAYDDGIVIALDRMARIIEIDPVNRLAEVQPGVITSVLDAAAREHGLFYAPDPASSRTSTIGGNVATNAGGLRCIAHGVTADAVLALEVVLADGRILHTGTRTTKNSAGYDLTRLFVGSEGTLGVITRVTVRLTPVPLGTAHTFQASFDDIRAAGDAVIQIANGPVRPEALELMDALSVELIERYRPSGLGAPGAALLVGQVISPTSEADARALTDVCRALGATRVAVADDDSLLEARRLVNPSLNAEGLRVGSDLGVPIGSLADAFDEVAAIARRHDRRIAVVAHAGDGNLHATVETRGDDPREVRLAHEIAREMAAFAVSVGGTVTGEHGIGVTKRADLDLQFDDTARAVFASIKNALDPRGILTPDRAI